MHTTIIVLAALAIAGAVYYKLRNRKAGDIEIPAPGTPRTDLFFGYYGCETGQAAEVKSHTNLHWECQFNGAERAADDILTMGCFTVLDVAPQMFERIADSGKNHALRKDAASRLYQLFDYLSRRGALEYVKVLTPLDEPNTNCRSPQDLSDACQILRHAASNYPELIEVKLGCIYAAKPESFTCIEQFDWVGVDDYDEKSQIFVNGTYAALIAAKRPEAKTILLPGGAFGQDPTPFVNFAHGNLEVAAIVAFCWFGPREPADKWVGIRYSGALRLMYEVEGATIKLWGEA